MCVYVGSICVCLYDGLVCVYLWALCVCIWGLCVCDYVGLCVGVKKLNLKYYALIKKSTFYENLYTRCGTFIILKG